MAELKNKPANDEITLKSRPIFAEKVSEVESLDMNNFCVKYVKRRRVIKKKEDFIKYYK